MRAQDISEAMNYIDEDLILDAERVVRVKKIKPLKIIAISGGSVIAAVLALGIGLSVFFANSSTTENATVGKIRKSSADSAVKEEMYDAAEAFDDYEETEAMADIADEEPKSIDIDKSKTDTLTTTTYGGDDRQLSGENDSDSSVPGFIVDANGETVVFEKEVYVFNGVRYNRGKTCMIIEIGDYLGNTDDGFEVYVCDSDFTDSEYAIFIPELGHYYELEEIED